MDIWLLGPMTVRRADGTEVTPSAPKRRALLSALAVRLNQPVSAEQLIELVWAGVAPPTARAALQGHVAALRQLLDDPRLALGTRGGGYVLEGDADRVDLVRFGSLCDRAGVLLPEPAARVEPDDPAVPLLRTALDLWRGPALADCGSELLRERTLPYLTDLRLRALDRLAEALLRAGRGGELTAELAEAAAAHPTRRILAARLIQCLEQAGRGAEAREWHERTAARSSPRRQTPPDRRFVGRAAELARLHETLALAARTGRPILVTGPAGVGKTALVRHWAAQRFPDGVLYADLRGFDPDGPRQPADVLGGFLTDLGLAPDALPAEPEDRAARYRELLADRRMVILLDDAASYRQLAPLLPDRPSFPSDGAGPVAVVTSRGRLRELLVHEDALPLPLGPLTAEDSHALLARTLGPEFPDRPAADPEAVAEIAEGCDHLPLALRLAAARLAARPDWSAEDLAAELADEQTGLDALAGTGTGRGPTGITAALDRTYRTLPRAAARLFTLLGLHPGTVLDTATAAALADLPRGVTRTLLAALDTVHLLEEVSPGRFARRELVRRYAARQAAELGCEERFVALDRLIAHYLELTADWTAEGSAPGGGTRAASWFRREESALRAVVVCAEQYGRTVAAWQLAHRIGLLYETTGHDRTHWRAVAEAGLRAAHAGRDESAVARLGTDLAVLHIDREAHRTAVEHLERAVAAADRAGDAVLRHHCRSRVAAALLRAGRHDRAVPILTDLVAAARTPAADHLLVRSLTDLADALALAGAPERALAHADEAVRTATARTGGAEAVLAAHSRARALHALGRREAALSSARLAVALARSVGDAAVEARSHGLLADLLFELGRRAEGEEARRRERERGRA
ncbi:BTAD domain-containing putative transcriptional regulator [Kitasatospora sp. NPDC018058]|uniref:AfsR/SARP family transcriptional regulator n=1 Tax=Kitasatospora sp. NPDC018058 TaxID=3364025 RepID=UPI0037C1A87B